MTGSRIDYLAAHPEHVASLARLHFEQWGAILPDWSYAAAFAELASHGTGPVIPTTLVALGEDDALLGSCSLLATDHESMRDYAPWLASLYVVEGFRRHGIGRALVERVVEDAAELGVPTLYLYTQDAQSYYASLGWRRHAPYRFGSLEVDVMAIEPRRARAFAT